jgi:L-histidine N-alpha-methyltransferase
VANKILGTDFNPGFFQHHAFFDEQKQRIEMHLVAASDMTVTSEFFVRDLELLKGQNIHTENSYKSTTHYIGKFAIVGGFSVRAVFTDRNNWFPG